MSNDYWATKTISRRRALQRMAVAGGAFGALSLVGCGGDDDSGPGASASPQAVDSRSGVHGGTFVVQTQGFSPSHVMVQVSSGVSSSFAHASLLQMKASRPGIDPYSTEVEGDLAASLPEQPDPLTMVFKLKDARFQNGKPVTSQDVAYSLDRYANWPNSSFKAMFSWLDKVETPDAKTAVVKFKQPFAEANTVLSDYSTFMISKEFEESPEAVKGFMGAGPYVFQDVQVPIQMRFKRNPDYHDKPYPYFDEVVLLGGQDDAARVSSWTSGQASLSWHQSNPSNYRQMEQGRPDAVKWGHNYAGHGLRMRVDKPPFNDKRVRQALSMSIDRKQVREATSGGVGEDDQILSWVIGGDWGFRKPKDLGNAAKYWNYDIQAAKQLLSASGASLPIKANLYHTDVTFLGQAFVDHATLAMAKWKENGIADLTAVQQPLAQIQTSAVVGNYEGVFLYPSNLANAPTFGLNIRSMFYSPPGGVVPPSLNSTFTNNDQLSGLVEKQLTQLNSQERKATLRQVEDLLAEEQYWNIFSAYPSYTYTDPKLRNIQVPKFWFGGLHGSCKYWWFEK